MSDGSANLSSGLVKKLSENPTAESRVDVAAQVGQVLSATGLAEKEEALASDIIRLLSKYAEARVRQSLADAVRSAPNLPKDVALTLANDIADVAVPILTGSVVLTDEDLLEIVAGGEETKQLAIAGRPEVSSAVSDALVETGSENVVVRVVENKGADISAIGLETAIDRFGNSPRLHGPMINRDNLPVAVSERLVALVSDKLREELVAKHELPAAMATDLVLEGRERATLSLVSDDGPSRRVEDLVAALLKNGRLTDTVVLRAACTGDLSFVAAALAMRAGVPVTNAQKLIDDEGEKGLKVLVEKAKFGRRDSLVLRAAINAAKSAEMVDQAGAMEKFAETVIERVLTTFDTSVDAFDDEDVNYLMAKLEKYGAQRSLASWSHVYVLSI